MFRKVKAWHIALLALVVATRVLDPALIGEAVGEFAELLVAGAFGLL